MLKVMANNDNNPFADYLWMGEMEKFDEKLQEELLEEEFIKSCIEQLLEEEEERETVYFRQQNGQNGYHNNQNQNPYQNTGNQQVPRAYTNGVESVTQDMGSLYVNQTSKDNNLPQSSNQITKNSTSTAPLKVYMLYFFYSNESIFLHSFLQTVS